MSDTPVQAASSKRVADHANDYGSDDLDEGSASKRRRMRYRVACLPCQRKKCKCDGGAPCASCQQRKCTEKCEYGPVKFKDGSVAQLEYADLKRRVMQLEAKLNKLDHLFPPEDVDTKPIASTSRGLSEGLDLSVRVSQVASESDNLSETGQAYEDAAEAAAMLLEEKTLGREQYGPLGGSRTVIHGNFTKPARDPAASSNQSTYLEDGSFRTDITHNSMAHGGRSSQQVPFARQAAMSELIEAVPSPELGDFLVSEHLNSLDWVYKVIHRGLFLDEIQQLWSHLRNGTADQIDPAWLALFFMVLSWPAHTDLVRRAVPALYNLHAKDIEAMAERWRHCAEKALLLADWAGTPQIRVLQALCLIMNYQEGKAAYPAAGNTAFYIWLASTVRIAQIMKLDRADEQDSTWLATDPAFPPGPSGIKQEICRRIWSLLLVSDWVFNSHGGRPSITLGSFTTPDPKRVNDEDLGRSLDYIERAPHELTDVDFFTVRLGLAKFQHAVNKFWASSTKTYQMILELDTHLQHSLSEIPATVQSSNAYNKPHHRSVALCILHNRRLRLHRPFLIRGLRGPSSRYAVSAQQCIKSAATICSSLDAIVDAQKLDVFWYIFSQVLAAVICLFGVLYAYARAGISPDLLTAVDHFHRVMTSPENVKLAISNPSIASAKRLYDAGLNSTVASVVQAARRGRTVVEALCQYEDELRNEGAGSINIEEKLTSILHRAAELIERAGLESAAASPIAAPVLLSDFLALDTYSNILGDDSECLAPQTGEPFLQGQDTSLPLQNGWLGQGGLVDWSRIFLNTGDPGLFGP